MSRVKAINLLLAYTCTTIAPLKFPTPTHTPSLISPNLQMKFVKNLHQKLHNKLLPTIPKRIQETSTRSLKSLIRKLSSQNSKKSIIKMNLKLLTTRGYYHYKISYASPPNRSTLVWMRPLKRLRTAFTARRPPLKNNLLAPSYHPIPLNSQKEYIPVNLLSFRNDHHVKEYCWFQRIYAHTATHS